MTQPGTPTSKATTPPPAGDRKLKDGADLDVECPKCGGPTRVRTNRENGSRFMGCVEYPTCNGTSPIPTFQKMKALGHPTLPGF